MEIASELSLPQRGAEGLDPSLETTVYRVLQETLTNVARHAKASTVRVAAIAGAGEVLVEVQDDGVGFDTDAQTAGFGLTGMRERVYLAGGSIEVQSGGSGTLVRVRLSSPAREAPHSLSR